MRIISSSDDKKLSRGESVTLLCASVCTFHQLEVTWFKDGHALSDTGPSLRLSPLTAEDSGNYTCALKNTETLSEPHSLQVEAGGLFSFLKMNLKFEFDSVFRFQVTLNDKLCFL
uniref:Ig-like domain-containing protein n=1 Tax=Neolamprologus brichardi TaxID=32507 RepID=A0A3Q4GBV5_NEOBR